MSPDPLYERTVGLHVSDTGCRLVLGCIVLHSASVYVGLGMSGLYEQSRHSLYELYDQCPHCRGDMLSSMSGVNMKERKNESSL